MDVFVMTVCHKCSFITPLYFVTGSGDKVRVIDISKVYEELGSDILTALIGFHSFTGNCDSISAFNRKGKLKPFKLFAESQEFVDTFNAIGQEFS